MQPSLKYLASLTKASCLDNTLSIIVIAMHINSITDKFITVVVIIRRPHFIIIVITAAVDN